jgi:hypothetical protein
MMMEITATYPANSIILLVIPQGTPQAFDTWVDLPKLVR